MRKISPSLTLFWILILQSTINLSTSRYVDQTRSTHDKDGETLRQQNEEFVFEHNGHVHQMHLLHPNFNHGYDHNLPHPSYNYPDFPTALFPHSKPDYVPHPYYNSHVDQKPLQFNTPELYIQPHFTQ